MSLREDVNKIYLNCLQKLEPKKIVSQFFTNQKIFDNFHRIFPVAFGKAALSMMEGCLKKKPTNKIYKKPIIVTLKSQEKVNYDVDLHFSSHPIPDEHSIKGSETIIKYLEDSNEKDLILLANVEPQFKFIFKPFGLVPMVITCAPNIFNNFGPDLYPAPFAQSTTNLNPDKSRSEETDLQKSTYLC